MVIDTRQTTQNHLSLLHLKLLHSQTIPHQISQPHGKSKQRKMSNQTFYTLPYAPSYLFMSIGFAVASYTIFSALTEPYTILTVIRTFEIAFISGICIFAVLFDPATTFSTKKQIVDSEGNPDVAASGENGEGGRGEGRTVTIIRPLVGLKHLKYCLDTNDMLENLRSDGVLYGEALFEI